MVLLMRSFTEKTKGSNSTEHQMSLVNLHTEMELETKDNKLEKCRRGGDISDGDERGSKTNAPVHVNLSKTANFTDLIV
jgi:hypothetical protein